jgi:hypothetical protein
VTAQHRSLQQKHDAMAGSQKQRSATASTRTWVAQELRPVAGGYTHGSTGQRPSPERVSTCAGHSCACAHTASPCPLGATVWKPEVQHETALWRTNVPCKTVHGSTAGIHTRLIARRQRAQEHEWPRSSDPSWGGSSAARWPAHRQVEGLAVRLDAAGSTQGRNQGGGEGKTAAVALTLGR